LLLFVLEGGGPTLSRKRLLKRLIDATPAEDERKACSHYKPRQSGRRGTILRPKTASLGERAAAPRTEERCKDGLALTGENRSFLRRGKKPRRPEGERKSSASATEGKECWNFIKRSVFRPVELSVRLGALEREGTALVASERKKKKKKGWCAPGKKNWRRSIPNGRPQSHL